MTDKRVTDEDVSSLTDKLLTDTINTIEFIRQFDCNHKADIATSVGCSLIVYSFEKVGCSMKEAITAMDVISRIVLEVYRDKLEELQNATRQ